MSHAAQSSRAPEKGERLVVEAWRKILSNDLIRTTDNFFDLGGTSLQYMTLIDYFGRRGVELTLDELFENQTPELLGSLIDGRQLTAPSGEDGNCVVTNAGRLAGVEADGAIVYRGVEYGSGHAHGARWRPPGPPRPWRGIRIADEFGPECPQIELAVSPQSSEYAEEDCFTLNIWRPPGGAGRLPVMFWISGGAFVIGSGNWRIYDGQELAKRGAVVVTVNYRVGRLGFFTHPLLARASEGATGNFGLMDQMAALRWVRDNIHKFGGDGDNITLCGESAGAICVAALMTNPEADGLFSKAILLSGGTYGGAGEFPVAAPLTPSGGPSAEEAGAAFVEALNRTPVDAAELRAIPLAELIDPGANGLGAGIGPIVGGYGLERSIFETLRSGRQSKAPFLIGTTTNDTHMWITRGLDGRALPASSYETRGIFAPSVEDIRRYWTQAGAAAQAHYRGLARSSAEMAQRLGADRFAAYARAMADALCAQGQTGFVYSFDAVPGVLQGRSFGSPHGTELVYLFGTFDTIPALAASTGDRQISTAMMDYWINFMQSGDPNGADLPRWQAYEPASPYHVVFGNDGIRLQDYAQAEGAEAFRNLVEAELAF